MKADLKGLKKRRGRVRRRTTVFYRGLADEDATQRAEELLARASGATTA